MIPAANTQKGGTSHCSSLHFIVKSYFNVKLKFLSYLSLCKAAPSLLLFLFSNLKHIKKISSFKSRIEKPSPSDYFN